MISGPRRFARIAGHLALDFANTVGNHASPLGRDYLATHEDLVQWAWDAGFIAPQTAETLLSHAGETPGPAAATLKTAVALREAIYRTFSALAHGRSAPTEDLEFLNALLAQYPATLQVVRDSERFACIRRPSLLDEAKLLGPIAWATAELLASDLLPKVRECGDADCGWLFLDLTKNHSRRWCEMRDCGSRAKAKRYYQRKTGRA